MKRLIFLVILAALPLVGNASDIYITQATSGGGTGADCVNAHSASWFNSNASGGNTYHLCGTFTGTAGSTMLTVPSGSAGNLVTIVFESGAILTAPYWGDATDGAIQVAGSYILIDGQANGKITNTANGDSLTNHAPSNGIWINTNSAHVEIRNLTITHIYDSVAGGTGAYGATSANTYDIGMSGSLSDINVHNNTLQNAAQGISYGWTGTASNVNLYNNTISDHRWQIVIGSSATSGSSSGINIYGNDISDYQNWTTTNDYWHLDGVIIWGHRGFPTNANVYNNYFHASASCCQTGEVFTTYDGGGGSGTASVVYIFNNILYVTDITQAHPVWANPYSQPYYFNNTIVTNTSTGGVNADVLLELETGTQATFANNIFYIAQNAIGTTDTTCCASVASSDYNLYNTINADGAFGYNGNFLTLAQWQGYGFDLHAQTGAPNLSGTYTLQAGSAAIGHAANLYSTCNGQPVPGLGALCYDKAGAARPTSAAWDIGAYQYATTTYTLSTATTGAGAGTVTCSPTGSGISSGTAYSCTVTATSGSTLVSVTGCGGSGTTTYSGTMPASDCAVTATFDLLGPPYYISPSGNDSNPGTVSLPWLSPNHALNGGDKIYASAGTYDVNNFKSGKWGTVTTSGSFAHLICSTFDTCKITASTNYGMYVDKSYWEVEGWEVGTTSSGHTCFAAAPAVSSPANISHVIFANDIANGCGGGGFSTFNVGTVSIDYVAFVGDIAYNAAQNSTQCYSGMTMYQPLASDTVAGTHLYVGGNFAWGNTEPSTCAGGATGGGDGFISDTFDGSQGLGTQYGQQLYVEQNLFVGNGAYGIQHQTYTKNPATIQSVYWRHNTSWGNLTNSSFNTNSCFEMVINIGYGVHGDHNIAQPNVSTACTSHTVYAAYAYDTSAATSTIANNWFYAPSGSGTTTGAFNDDGNTFSFGTNSAGSPPVSAAFSAPAVPGAPSCGSALSVPDCMATVLANFAPTAGGTTGFGVQAVSGSDGGDALFPRWVCGQIPTGLVTESCLSVSQSISGNANFSGKVQ